MNTAAMVVTKPISTFVATFLVLVGFALFLQHFGYLLIILGPLMFLVMFLWLVVYAPLLLIPMTHYDPPDMNMPFLTLSGLALYSTFVGAFVAAALHGSRRIRLITRALLAVLVASNVFGAYLLWGTF